jgi:protein TonB
MAEHRFFQTFLTVGASMMLVGGGLVLLTSTSPFTSPPAVTEASTPDSARVVATAPDQTRLSQPVEATPDLNDAAAALKEPDTAQPEAALAPDIPSPDDDAVAALGTPLTPEPDEANQEDTAEGMAVADDVAQPDSAANNDASVEAEPAASPELEVTTAPAEPDDSVAGDKADAATEPSSVAEDKTGAASDQIGEMLAGLPPRVIASDKSSAATGDVAQLLAASPPAPTPAPAPAREDARPELAVVTTPPPLPRRKPEEDRQAHKVAALPLLTPQEKPSKPAEPAQAPEVTVARREATEPHAKSQWQPMALAPADKPAIAAVPTARPTGPAYASKVWSALARHKPRAGQSGSATVAFAIGENGGLRGLKIGRSSGNARIDQLALATVRGAAPFPPPPSGTASYSIRIDFH